MLITEAPLATACSIASPDAAQVISPVGARRGLQRDVERPRARPHAEDADAVLRRGGHGHRRRAVRVVDRRAGDRGDVRVARPFRVGRGRRRRPRARSAGSAASPAAASARGRRRPRASRWAGRRAGRRDRLQRLAQDVGLGVDEQPPAFSASANAARLTARHLVARRSPRSRSARALKRLAISADARARLGADEPGVRIRTHRRGRRRRPAGPSADPARRAAGARISRAAKAAAKARVTGKATRERRDRSGASPEPTLGGWTSSPSCPV